MNVNGRTVCVVESHEEVLCDWAQAARDAGHALTLLTLDRHLDTAPALTAEFAEEVDLPAGGRDGRGGGAAGPPGALARRRRRVLSRFRGAGPRELGGLIARLRNDEHIDAALRLGIIDRALIVCSGVAQTAEPSLPGVAIHRPVCAPGCGGAPHAGARCERRRYDAMLESALLGVALADLGLGSLATADYVLDIDLDTFSTRRGLAPVDASVFHALIAGARLVTIAREPEYVSESLDAHGADEIEAAVLRHVAAAMDTVGRAGPHYS